MLLFLAAVAALGPHAAEAQLHAQDPEAAWVRAQPGPPIDRSSIAAPALSKRIYGYLPSWSAIDLNSFHWDLITDVIAFSADLATDGTVTSHGLPGAALTSAAHAHGVKVHLCATLFNTGAGEITTFLGSSAAKDKAVQQLVALASGIDGINLDFEFVSSGSRSAFTDFVQRLHAALRSAAPGAELTLAMPSSTSYAGYDAAALAAATERLLLMEYDYHWASAPTSGANAPLPQVQEGVGSFLAAALAASIAMGVPYYGWDWPTASASPGANTLGKGTAVFFKSVFTNFAIYGRYWDGASQTPWYYYSSGVQVRQAWVEDNQSLALKYRYVNSKNLAGIMIWALGYDGTRSESWAAIKEAFGSSPAPDAGTPDAGTPDAGTHDAGAQDAGSPAGLPLLDAGTDGGGGTALTSMGGCTQAGATTWALVLGLLLVLGCGRKRMRRRPD